MKATSLLAALFSLFFLFSTQPLQAREVSFIPSATEGLSSPRRTLNVLDFGVFGDGLRDDAPALRRIFASKLDGATILFPSGRRYLIASAVAPLDYPAMVPAGVIVSGKTNFSVEAQGATFVMAPQAAFSTFFLFDRSANWAWHGGRFQHSRHGLHREDENVGLVLINVRKFTLSDASFSGLGGMGAALAGDWIVDGRISGLSMQGVGICFDFSFLKRVEIANSVGRGDGTAGLPGDKCFSNIYDAAYRSLNRTGVVFSQSEQVTVKNLTASNFNTGVAISSGRYFRFLDNRIYANPGSGAAAGIGYYLHADLRGPYSSIAHPVRNVVIRGGLVTDNGSAKRPGFGVLVSSEGLNPQDGISDIAIENVRFRCNRQGNISQRGAAVQRMARKGNSENESTACRQP